MVLVQTSKGPAEFEQRGRLLTLGEAVAAGLYGMQPPEDCFLVAADPAGGVAYAAQYADVVAALTAWMAAVQHGDVLEAVGRASGKVVHVVVVARDGTATVHSRGAAAEPESPINDVVLFELAAADGERRFRAARLAGGVQRQSSWQQTMRRMFMAGLLVAIPPAAAVPRVVFHGTARGVNADTLAVQLVVDDAALRGGLTAAAVRSAKKMMGTAGYSVFEAGVADDSSGRKRRRDEGSYLLLVPDSSRRLPDGDADATPPTTPAASPAPSTPSMCLREVKRARRARPPPDRMIPTKDAGGSSRPIALAEATSAPAALTGDEEGMAADVSGGGWLDAILGDDTPPCDSSMEAAEMPLDWLHEGDRWHEVCYYR